MQSSPVALGWLPLVHYAGQPATSPRRILEIGPGTGAVTRRIVAALGSNDQLDLVELNGNFVRTLNHRFATEPAFQAMAPRSRVLHCSLEEPAMPIRPDHLRFAIE